MLRTFTMDPFMKVFWLERWNQCPTIWVQLKFPKLGCNDDDFLQFLLKATWWAQVHYLYYDLAYIILLTHSIFWFWIRAKFLTLSMHFLFHPLVCAIGNGGNENIQWDLPWSKGHHQLSPGWLWPYSHHIWLHWADPSVVVGYNLLLRVWSWKGCP